MEYKVIRKILIDLLVLVKGTERKVKELLDALKEGSEDEKTKK